MKDQPRNDRGFSLTTVVVAWVVGIACAAIPLASALNSSADEALETPTSALDVYEATDGAHMVTMPDGTKMVCEPVDGS